jgi:hypothetical protein
MPDSSWSLQQFVAEIDRNFDRQQIESIWDCRGEFSKLLHFNVATKALNDELLRLKADAAYVGDWRPNHLILHRGEGFILSVAYFERPHRYIHSSPFYGFYAPLHGETLVYEKFLLPEQYRNEVFDPSIRITSAGTHTVSANEVLELRTDRTIYDIKVPRPQLVLKLTTAAYHTLEWLFTRDTLSAWQANDADLRSTQLRVSAYLLGRLGDESSVDSLRWLAGHPNHSVRWAAIQALGRLSRSEGLVQLERAATDTHPHIRRAAQKALSLNKLPKAS